ncbi:MULTISPECIES: nitroreductase family protein [Pseudomonas]|uniref:Putative NAD(P)H nitroreductase n=1 Tax=Pseudomonas flexibilis TaxID=706570 RepID=A0A0B2DCG4_9PSED|nr:MULTISPECIES: nitroreductase family protein [Pseudomonas]KHL70625.1 putative oxidoreductase [Pseudomonas flexibilis]KHO66144.1 nitroreductase [Pseudomonas flexibilis]SCY44765.1 Nitroreductase [Pseudomonas flexibilis]SIR14957.1 Nitroreductase [Pseudomonas flexibilis]
MEALDALLTRVSVPRLHDPAPDAAQRQLLFRAALRAPDHGQLRPWRFLTIEGAARERLGELFAQAVSASGAKPEMLAKARAMPLRAPLLVVVIASPKTHFKVPESEQLLSAGCAAHGIVIAAHALGLGAIWRSGDLSHDPLVKAGLGVGAKEQIVGFIYLGRAEGERRTPQELDPGDFVTAWQG